MSNTNQAPALANQPKRLDKRASIAVVRKCHRGQEICGQGCDAARWSAPNCGAVAPVTSSALPPATSMIPRSRRSPKIRSWPAIRAGELPISRYDIADYLGLSVETVCRSLTSLKKRGLIALSGPRSVRIIDRDALEEGGRMLMLTRNTSGLAGVALIYQRIPLERRGQL